MVGTLFLLFTILLALAAPIFVVLSLSTLAAFALHSAIPLQTIVQRLFAGLDKFALMAIPFFILAANVMSAGGMSRRIIAVANVLVGPLPGGLAMATVVACMFFGAISGSSPATVVAMGGLLYPALVKAGYGRGFSIGLIVASGSIALIIPPSITMIVYGAVTGASVGALFVSGFGAGAVYGLGFMVHSYVYARRRKIPPLPRPSGAEIRATLADAKWGLGMPILIIGGIYGGVFTPTEAAAVAAVYAIVVALLIYREISWSEFWAVTIQSAGSTAQVMILLAGASVFAYILTSERVTVVLTESILRMGASQFAVLILINVALLIAGMLIDGASIILILAPLLLPVATKIGVDSLHLGIIMVVNTAIGMFTPPFGLNLFVAGTVDEEWTMTRLIPEILPFVWVSLIPLLIITYVPGLSLWLPRLIYGVR
ncbi:MAG: TRAP transporter large permease [Candidatus Methylomirabilales bacterium]